MSQENMKAKVRQTFEAVNSRDVAVFQAACDPEVELTSRFAAIDGKTYSGHAGVSDYAADMQAIWEDFRLEVEEFIAGGAEKLVAVTSFKAVSHGSRVPIGQRTFGAYEFRHGKIWRARFYRSRQEALEAVGLSE